MNTPAHTPAPWGFSPGSSPHNQAQIYCEDTGATIAITYADEHAATARLIAAAPELLAALQRLLDCPDLNLGNLEAESTAAMHAAESAIAKATA